MKNKIDSRSLTNWELKKIAKLLLAKRLIYGFGMFERLAEVGFTSFTLTRSIVERRGFANSKSGAKKLNEAPPPTGKFYIGPKKCFVIVCVDEGEQSKELLAVSETVNDKLSELPMGGCS